LALPATASNHFVFAIAFVVKSLSKKKIWNK